MDTNEFSNYVTKNYISKESIKNLKNKSMEKEIPKSRADLFKQSKMSKVSSNFSILKYQEEVVSFAKSRKGS